jgi:hemerythrin-like metal-binding domain
MLNLFTDRLLVQVEKIDEQHKIIFSIIEEFYNVSMNGGSKEDIVQVFNNLKNHLEQHFADEEGYMIKYNFENYEEHKEKHNVFMRKVYTLENAFKCEHIPLTKLAEANEFFSEGLLTHISEVDDKLGAFLRDKF